MTSTRNGGDIAARKGLLDVALRLFSRKGFADTSVREIVHGAGVTAPTLYYYFNNKEGVYVHLLEQCSNDFLDHMIEAGDESMSLRDHLLALSQAQLSFARACPDQMRFLLGALHGHQEQTRFVDLAELRRRCLMPAEVALNGAVDDPQRASDLALTYAGVVHAWIEALLDGRRADASPCAAFIDQLVASL